MGIQLLIPLTEETWHKNLDIQRKEESYYIKDGNSFQGSW